jgi:lauroyl/myristoyl acyltransferase
MNDLDILDNIDDYGHILQTLAQGGGPGLVGDWDVGPKRLFVACFSRPASKFNSSAFSGLDNGSRIVAADVILPEEYVGQPEALRAITQRYNTALEWRVRRHPEQYSGLRRRWQRPCRAGA